MLDKHKLTLQLSKRSATGSGAAGSKAKKALQEADGKGAKLVVRNVAFEATKKDIMGLFGPFGHLKSCRCACAVVGYALTAARCVHRCMSWIGLVVVVAVVVFVRSDTPPRLLAQTDVAVRRM